MEQGISFLDVTRCGRAVSNFPERTEGVNSCAPGQGDASASRRPRGPQRLGEQAACALAAGLGSGEDIGAVEEEAFLKPWFEENGRLIPEDEGVSDRSTGRSVHLFHPRKPQIRAADLESHHKQIFIFFLAHSCQANSFAFVENHDKLFFILFS